MDKLMTDTSDAARLLSECELDAVVGGFVIYGAEARGFVVDWAVAFCSNNLRDPAIPPDRRC
jgi:hypothetical protein